MLSVVGCSPRGPQHASTRSARETCGGTWRDLLADDRPTPTEKQPEPFHAHKLVDPALVLSSVTVASDSPGLNSLLATLLQTAPGQVLSEAPIDADLRRLWKLDVLDDIQVEVDGTALSFVVTPHARVGHVVGAKGDALRRLALTAGAPFEPARISRMAEAARMVYVKDGHLDAAVDVYRHPTSDGAMDLCVAAAPGPRFTVGETRVVGTKHVSDADLKKEFCEGNNKGDVLDEAVAECTTLRVTAAFWDHGYANVKLGNPQYVRHASTIDIEIPLVEEGPQFRYGVIAFTNGPPAKNVLRTGAVFSREAIMTAISGIQHQTGASDVLPVTHVDLEAKRIDITFEYSWRSPLDVVTAYLRGAK